MPDVAYNVGGSGSNYIKFLSTKSAKFHEYKQRFPAAEEGTPILVANGEESLLPVVKVMTLAAHVFWAKVDSGGEVQAVSLKPPMSTNDLCDTDCVDAVHLLFMANGSIEVIHASYRRKTRTQFMSSVLQQLKKVETEEWFSKSDHHRFTSGIKEPYARFTSTMGFKRDVSKASKNLYCAITAQHAPVTVEEYKKLVEFMKDEENRASVTGAISSFNTRKANIIKQAG